MVSYYKILSLAVDEKFSLFDVIFSFYSVCKTEMNQLK